MARGQPMQLVEVGSDGQLIFHRGVLDAVVTLCGAHPLAIYTVAGEFRKGKTTLLNIFVTFNELGLSWKQDKETRLSGFEARGGSIKCTSGIWVWSQPFFSSDPSGKKVAIILMDTQGTFDQDTSLAVNSFIFGFSLAVSSILMYNNMEQISSQDVNSLITFGTTFIPMVEKFQTLSFLIRDWDDEERFTFGSDGGGMMINDLLNPGDGTDAQVSGARRGIKNMFQSVSGFLLPRPGTKIERAKGGEVSVRDMDDDFVKYVDDLCQEIFVRNVKPFTHKGKEMNGSDWLTIFDHLVKANKEGKIMDPGFHQDGFTGSSVKSIKDEVTEWYRSEMTKNISWESRRTGLSHVTESYLNQTDAKLRQDAMKSFNEKTAHFGKQDAIEAQMVGEVSKWFNEQCQENRRAKDDHEKAEENRRRLEEARRESEYQHRQMVRRMEQMRIDTERRMAEARERAAEEARQRRERDERRRREMAIREQEENERLHEAMMEMNRRQAEERRQRQAEIERRQKEMDEMRARLRRRRDDGCCIL